MKSHDVIKSIVTTIDKSLLMLNKSSGVQASKGLTDTYTALKRLARKLDDLVDVEEADPEDLYVLEGHLENMKEICTRRFYNDTRSWDDRASQKEDAKIALQTMKMFWDGANAAKANLPGLPAYRFKVGEQVKVISSKRSGKVISVSCEGGTGKQLFVVKFPNEDKPRKFYVRQLGKVAKKPKPISEG